MKILLAMDGSVFSGAARDALIAHSKVDGVEVRLLHVLEPFPAPLAETLGSKVNPDFAAARLKERERAKKLLAQATQELEGAGFKVSSSLEEGDPKSVILREAEAWGADLIILGSHGRTGLDRFLMGSVSEAVARHAHCSVQIVRTQSVG